MDIVSSAQHWAKGEVASSRYFMLFGVVYIVIAFCSRQMANTPLTQALYIPILLAGGLLLAAGIGFYFSNTTKLKNFATDYQADPTAMVESEITRTAQTIKSYENVALKVFPAVILLATLVAMFISTPVVRAICIAIIAFLSVLVLLDSQALKRIKTYHQELELVENKLRN